MAPSLARAVVGAQAESAICLAAGYTEPRPIMLSRVDCPLATYRRVSVASCRAPRTQVLAVASIRPTPSRSATNAPPNPDLLRRTVLIGRFTSLPEFRQHPFHPPEPGIKGDLLHPSVDLDLAIIWIG